jgi:uncharacterized damage-inducible protein DinB
MTDSIHVAQFRAFARYNARFNRTLFDLASRLDDEQRTRDMGAFFGSIDGTLRHILGADRIWLGRFAASGHDFPTLEEANLTYEVQGGSASFPGDFASLQAERIATDQVIVSWVEELTDAILAAPMKYASLNGTPREHETWIAVAHLFNHQTHHRGQATTLFKQLGIDVGVTDFLVYALER